MPPSEDCETLITLSFSKLLVTDCKSSCAQMKKSSVPQNGIYACLLSNKANAMRDLQCETAKNICLVFYTTFLVY